MRLSIGVDNRDQILKDIDSLSLEKYIDEIANAALEGIARCKTEKDAWAAAEVSTMICRRVARSPVYQPHDMAVAGHLFFAPALLKHVYAGHGEPAFVCACSPF